MGQNNYPKGSEWCKWDLHVHTPYSYLNNEFGDPENSDTWDNYVKTLFNKAIEKKIAVIGITDYFIIDGYKKIKHEYLENEDKLKSLFDNDEAKLQAIKNILILPNIEFRLDKFVGKHRINFHVIFSNDVSIDDIEDNFLNKIEFVYEGAPQTKDEKRSLNKRNLISLGQKLKQEHSKFASKSDIEVGMMNAVVNDEAIVETLSDKKSIFEGKYLLFIPADEDLSNISWDGQDHQTRKVLIQKCDGLISSNKNTIKWALGYKHQGENRTEQINNFVNEFKSLKPCIWGSDAHSFDRLFEPDQNRYTWIKADPTFEGLKQIIYEPEERVRIQEDNPQDDYLKHYFSKVIIKETNIFNGSEVKFKQNEIELNPNLVAIIGGRGTGKSLLLDAIAKTLKKIDGNERAASISIKKGDFSVTYTKSDNTNEEYKIQEENIVDYLHIHQGYVKAIVDPKNSGKLDKEIKELLNLNEKPEIPYDESFLSRLVDEIFEIKDYLNKIDENGEKINSKEYIEKQQKYKKKLIENITTKENKERISEYTNNIKIINDLDKKIQQLEDLKRDLEQFQSDKNNLIKGFNQLIDNKNKIPEISFDEQIQKINSLSEYCRNEKDNKESKNRTIKEILKNEGISGDITTLLEQAKKYQEEIDALENKKKLFEDKEKDLKEKFNKIKEVIDKISESYKKFEEEIKNKWSDLKKGKEGWDEEQKKLVNKLLKDIDIEVVESFDKDKFYEKIKETLNLNKFRATASENQNERISKFFNINSKVDFILFLKNEKEVNEGEVRLSEFINSEYFVKDGAKEFLRLILLNYSDFWQVITKPKYKSKELNQLSVGMKGTMYLCLKLATDPFMKPFIFDQPEDDLDNNFIVNELVPIFKTIKKYRQVIIVTHNANLVVNTDAEQVIVAENENETINYISGSLENVNIRNRVCEILEGGIDAFRKREKKYNIK
jgi:ABC-type Mn2+/Zn2+ transport system ATPase subunit/uncharacterized membrane-anchored protein YhcB (DUF1043 family)